MQIPPISGGLALTKPAGIGPGIPGKSDTQFDLGRQSGPKIPGTYRPLVVEFFGGASPPVLGEVAPTKPPGIGPGISGKLDTQFDLGRHSGPKMTEMCRPLVMELFGDAPLPISGGAAPSNPLELS